MQVYKKAGHGFLLRACADLRQCRCVDGSIDGDTKSSALLHLSCPVFTTLRVYVVSNRQKSVAIVVGLLCSLTIIPNVVRLGILLPTPRQKLNNSFVWTGILPASVHIFLLGICRQLLHRIPSPDHPVLHFRR